MMKKVISLVIIMTLILTPSLNTMASNNVENNLENISMTECNKFIMDLVLDILNKRSTFVDANVYYFTEQEYNNIKEYAKTNDILGNQLGKLVVDVTYPNNSSTQDTVIMANIKILSDDQQYNMIYLLELHINKEGKIYGHNIWIY